MKETQCLEFRDLKGRRHLFEWVNDVPLNGRKDAHDVNCFEYTLINAEGKRAFFRSWVTDLVIGDRNIADLVRGGRARWKIENEISTH